MSQSEKYRFLHHAAKDIKSLLEGNGWIFEIIQLHEWYESTFISETQLMQYFKKGDRIIRALSEGLNIKKTTRGPTFNRLPMYDLALMLSLAASPTSIANYIKDNYITTMAANPQRISSHIDFLFGSKRKAQEELILPVIKELYKEGFQTLDLILGFSQSVKNQIMDNSFIQDWITGKIKIDSAGIKPIISKTHEEWYGISIYSWLDAFQTSSDPKSISDELSIPISMVSAFESKFRTTVGISSKIMLSTFVRRAFTVYLVGRGWDLHHLYEEKLKPRSSRLSEKKYFEKLFNGLEYSEIERHALLYWVDDLLASDSKIVISKYLPFGLMQYFNPDSPIDFLLKL